MKAHELAKILDGFSKALKKLPDANIHDSIELINKLIDEKYSPKKGKERTGTTPPIIPEDIIKLLHDATAAEAESILNSNSLFVSTSSISNLAKILGIETSKRQNRSALINSIVRYLEARKMSSIIRNDSTAETKPQNLEKQ